MTSREQAPAAEMGLWPLDYRAAVDTVAVRELDLAVLRAGGRDRVRWLHKLITSDVERLQTGQGSRSALLDAKGHYQADFVVLALAHSILIVTEALQRERLLAALRRYIIRERVELTDESSRWQGWNLVGPGADTFVPNSLGAAIPAVPYSFSSSSRGEGVLLVRSQRAAELSLDLLAPVGSGIAVSDGHRELPRLSLATAELLRIEAGNPLWGQDFDSSTLALEIPPFISVRVDQGCYIGQEVVARLVHRGHVNRLLVGLRAGSTTALEPAEPLWHESSNVGRITSAALSPRYGSIALGYVRREVAQAGSALRTESGIDLVVTDTPFQK